MYVAQWWIIIMHVVSYHDDIWLLFSTVVLYHDMHGGMVGAQYSGLFKRKKSETLVLANNFHHIHHDNLLLYWTSDTSVMITHYMHQNNLPLFCTHIILGEQNLKNPNFLFIGSKNVYRILEYTNIVWKTVFVFTKWRIPYFLKTECLFFKGSLKYTWSKRFVTKTVLRFLQETYKIRIKNVI